MKYLVLKTFWYPQDAASIRAIKAGDNPSLKSRKMAQAIPGDIVGLSTDVVRSLAAQDGGPYIEEVTDGKA